MLVGYQHEASDLNLKSWACYFLLSLPLAYWGVSSQSHSILQFYIFEYLNSKMIK